VGGACCKDVEYAFDISKARCARGSALASNGRYVDCSTRLSAAPARHVEQYCGIRATLLPSTSAAESLPCTHAGCCQANLRTTT
jgi:hypothetical protein